jgi:cbb3-type cytochrome oxidase subunit 3
MRLSDIVGHMDLAVWPKMALVLFLAVFVAVTWRALRTSKAEMDRAASLPINDDAGASHV